VAKAGLELIHVTDLSVTVLPWPSFAVAVKGALSSTGRVNELGEMVIEVTGLGGGGGSGPASPPPPHPEKTHELRIVTVRLVVIGNLV
jgi:hypothetical protein